MLKNREGEGHGHSGSHRAAPNKFRVNAVAILNIISAGCPRGCAVRLQFSGTGIPAKRYKGNMEKEQDIAFIAYRRQSGVSY